MGSPLSGRPLAGGANKRRTLALWPGYVNYPDSADRLAFPVVDYFRFVRHPSSVYARRGDHFLQPDFTVPNRCFLNAPLLRFKFGLLQTICENVPDYFFARTDIDDLESLMLHRSKNWMRFCNSRTPLSRVSS